MQKFGSILTFLGVMTYETSFSETCNYNHVMFFEIKFSYLFSELAI